MTSSRRRSRGIPTDPKTLGVVSGSSTRHHPAGGEKGNKQWVWLALDTTTREIVGVYIGGAEGNSEAGSR
ncbi:MAG: hypothetical protein QNJ70_19045 [Xenococcaceae cyanobacterium MO_207.B15]|nr:hypothetical protein [Xenococcaceae cyanobacterium MO_207.B15]